MTISLGILFGAATCFLSQITALSLFVKFPSGGNSLALGFVGTAPAIGSLLLSPFMAAMITYGSWRSAMEILGGLFLVYLLLPLLLLRQENGKRSTRQREWVKSSGKGLWPGKKLYLLFSSFHLMSLAIYGVLSQEVAYATDQGISLTEAAWALGFVTGIGVLSSPLLGWIADRIQSKKSWGLGYSPWPR